jgi:hypothetical protein
VIADAQMNVTLSLSTNDQGKAWLNGKEVFRFEETRVLKKTPIACRSHPSKVRTCFTNLKISLTPQ